MSLLPGTTYYVRVKAVNLNSESDYSDTISVTTLSDSNLIDPITVTPPVIKKILTESNSCSLVIQMPSSYEQVQEYKLTLSINSDLSSPLYSDFIYQYNISTNIYTEDTISYILITIPNLTFSTTYYGRLKAINDLGLAYTNFTVTTEATIKSPLALGVTNLTQISAIANWSKVLGATSYLLDVSTTNNFSNGTLVVNGVDTGDVDNYQINVLVQNTVYWLRVRAKQGSIISKDSNIISFTTLDAVDTIEELTYNLDSPIILQKTNITTSRFTIKWSKINNAVSYILELSLLADFSTLENTINTQLTQYTATNLTSNTLYYARIKAVNNNSDSSYTLFTVSTLQGNITLNPPQLLVPTVIRSKSVILNWVKRSYASNYVLQISLSNTFNDLILDLYINNIDNLIVEGLNPTTVYHARIYGLSNSQSSIASETVSFTTSSALPAINLSSVTELSDTEVTLNWVTNVSYTKYLLTVYQDNFNYLGNGYYNKLDLGNVSKSKIDIFLQKNTTYKYFINGITANGDSNQSITGEFTTRESKAFIQISKDGQYLECVGNINRLEISTDSLFRNLVRPYSPYTITLTNNAYKLLNVLKSSINYYIRGYYQGTVKGLYSNVVFSINAIPRISEISVTSNSVYINVKQTGILECYLQIKVNLEGNYVPVTGHNYPVSLLGQDYYLLNNLTEDTEYSVDLFYLNLITNEKLKAQETIYFKTNLYQYLFEPNLDTELSAIDMSITDIQADRFTIKFNSSYSKYLIEISTRSDFIYIKDYIESNSSDYVYLCEHNTVYYVRAVGIENSSRTTVENSSITSANLPALPASLSTSPNIINTTILNENEATISFSTVTGATGYIVEVSKSNGFTILDNSISIEFLDSTKVLLSGLLGINTYYIRVYGYNSNSVSNYSNVITVDTTP